MWYSLRVNRLILKRILPLIVFILFLIPIISSSLLDLEQKRINEENYQKFLLEELAKNAEKKIYLMGKFDPSIREDFILIPLEYTTNGSEMYLRKETFDSFLRMKAAADTDGIELKIASATRNFDYQKNLWNEKWTGVTLVEGQSLLQSFPDELERFKKILEYSAVPGTSRHHWGTELDLNNSVPSYFDSKKGKKEYEWLIKNASAFGFCQTYNFKDAFRLTGYHEEKWHWSYLPLSRAFTEEYRNLIKNEDIKGFLGDEYVPFLNLINDYVLSINPDCI